MQQYLVSAYVKIVTSSAAEAGECISKEAGLERAKHAYHMCTGLETIVLWGCCRLEAARELEDGVRCWLIRLLGSWQLHGVFL